jgi:hypothetical protein
LWATGPALIIEANRQGANVSERFGATMDFNDLVQAIQTLNAEDAFRARLNVDQWRAISP